MEADFGTADTCDGTGTCIADSSNTGTAGTDASGVDDAATGIATGASDDGNFGTVDDTGASTNNNVNLVQVLVQPVLLVRLPVEAFVVSAEPVGEYNGNVIFVVEPAAEPLGVVVTLFVVTRFVVTLFVVLFEPFWISVNLCVSLVVWVLGVTCSILLVSTIAYWWIT